jgi:hypothetical protein
LSGQSILNAEFVNVGTPKREDVVKTTIRVLLTLGAAVALATGASAHHSFSAEFDAAKPVKITGIVTKVDWTNPHVWLYVNVKDEKGAVANWGAELGPPHGLQRSGWRRDTLTIGEQITIDGFLARNGSNRMNARTVTLASTGARPGATLDAASSAGSDAAKPDAGEAPKQ